MTALILIFVAMGSKDVLQALYVRLLGSRRPWVAGTMDGLSDLLTYGLVGISIYDHPHRTIAWTVAAFGLLVISSIIGTRLGYATERWLERRNK